MSELPTLEFRAPEGLCCGLTNVIARAVSALRRSEALTSCHYPAPIHLAHMKIRIKLEYCFFVNNSIQIIIGRFTAGMQINSICMMSCTVRLIYINRLE